MTLWSERRRPGVPWRRAGAAGVVCLSLAVAGCGGSGEPIASGAGPGGVPAQAPTTTTAPPDTAPPPTDIADDPRRWTAESAFVGPWWSDAAGTTSVVEQGSLTVTTTGAWKATGVVRNARRASVGVVTVTAVLRDAAGAILEEVAGDALVAPLRPGEPAPFALTGSTPAAQVASVSWATSDAPASGARPDLTLTEHWRAPREAPTLLFGTVEARSATGAAEVVYAWVDADARILGVGTVALKDLATGRPPSQLVPGEQADFELAVPAGRADAGLAMWGVAA